MLERIGGVLLELHRDCRLPTAEAFPGWAMRRAAAAISHDASFWGSGCRGDNCIVVHSFWFENVAPESMAAWERQQQIDSLAPMLMAEPGRVFNVTNEDMRRNHRRYYENFLHLYGVEQILCTYAFNPVSGIYEAISLYRSDPGNPFSEEERQAFACLVPNLVQARRVNYLSRMRSAEEAPCTYCAAADTKGLLHAIDDGFTQLLASEWPAWRGPRLPDEIVAQLASSSGRYAGKALVVESQRHLDMRLLTARRRLPLDDLSARQMEVAAAFADGLSHKEIAKSSGLSPATVRNHISAVYALLGIGSKAELASLLAKYMM